MLKYVEQSAETDRGERKDEHQKEKLLSGILDNVGNHSQGAHVRGKVDQPKKSQSP